MIDYLDTCEWIRHSAEATIPASPRATAAELRRAYRTPVVGSATLLSAGLPSAGLADMRVDLRDVSPFGVGFLLPRAVEPDSQWRIGFLNGAKRLGEQLVSVRYCRPFGSAYLAGAQFCAEPEILEKLGATPSALTAA